MLDFDRKSSQHTRGIDVFCRIRPLDSKARLSSYYRFNTEENSIEINAPDEVLKKNSGIQKYRFSRVFAEDIGQEEVYNSSVRDVLEKLLTDGKNGLIFSYGVTNAGKTHTIVGSPQHPGILPRLVRDLVRYKEMLLRKEEVYFIDKTIDLNGVLYSPADLIVSLQCFEIYNDEIFDLMTCEKGPMKGKTERPKLKIREINKAIVIEGVKSTDLVSFEQANETIDQCLENRKTASTSLNSNSSRSHTVFRVSVDLIIQAQSKEHSINKKIGYICVVDLAGSERANRAQTAGTGDNKLKEASGINNSLMTLGRCLTALKETKNENSVIPFRDSKLTHFLSEFFIEDSLIKMVTNINPCEDDFLESIRVLNYSSTAKEIKIIASDLRKNRLDCFKPPVRQRDSLPSFQEARRTMVDERASLPKNKSSGIEVEALLGEAKGIDQNLVKTILDVLEAPLFSLLDKYFNQRPAICATSNGRSTERDSRAEPIGRARSQAITKEEVKITNQRLRDLTRLRPKMINEGTMTISQENADPVEAPTTVGRSSEATLTPKKKYSFRLTNVRVEKLKPAPAAEQLPQSKFYEEARKIANLDMETAQKLSMKDYRKEQKEQFEAYLCLADGDQKQAIELWKQNPLNSCNEAGPWEPSQ